PGVLDREIDTDERQPGREQPVCGCILDPAPERLRKQQRLGGADGIDDDPGLHARGQPRSVPKEGSLPRDRVRHLVHRPGGTLPVPPEEVRMPAYDVDWPHVLVIATLLALTWLAIRAVAAMQRRAVRRHP